MPSLSLFGAQWGDEGKGKIIDSLAPEVDFVVRYQGGANAGHTVIVDGTKYVLHLIPSGVLHPGKVNVIGNGVALDPIALLTEIEELHAAGIHVGPDNLRLSARAHVLFDHHRGFDALTERLRGDAKIGTTGRGIGPCYADKASRSGLRVADLLDERRLGVALAGALAEKNAVREKVHGEPPLYLDGQLAVARELGARLAPFVGDTGAEVRDAFAAGKTVLFEAAQGVMLDIDHGTYPYVTSSSTGVNGIPSGAGFPARHLESALGIAKAYCTRVGEGPFPSEELGPLGEQLRAAGGEFGATTGRPRRCGWLDAVALRYALELNGAEGWILTKLDVLSGLAEIPVGVAYRADGQTFRRFPAHLAQLEGVEVEYDRRPGWSGDLSAVRHFDDLPQEAQNYVAWLEQEVGAPISMISVGPSREQLIPRRPGSTPLSGS